MSERVTKCKEDDCRKVPRGGAPSASSAYEPWLSAPLVGGGIRAKDSLDPAVLNAGRVDGRWGPLRQRPRVWCGPAD